MRERSNVRTKANLFALVADLRAEGLTRAQIAEALGYTPQRVGQVLADLHLQPKRFPSTLAAVEAMPTQLRQRVLAFRNETDVGTRATTRHLRAAEEQPR
jgi:hypothetical protein